MISAIIEKPHEFVLENDRSLPVEEQTIFHVIPKTQRSTNESAAAYAKAQKADRRRGTTSIDAKALDTADLKEWLNAVCKIQNLLIPVKSPENAHDHFLSRVEEAPTKFEKRESDGAIIVKETEDKSDLSYIYWAMSSAETEEVMKAYVDYGELRAGLKNG